jgi:signal transduction histidine kinase
MPSPATGEGLAEDAVDRIFEPFYTTKTGGLGLGLSIARSIAEARNENGGATFYLTLQSEPVEGRDV